MYIAFPSTQAKGQCKREVASKRVKFKYCCLLLCGKLNWKHATLFSMKSLRFMKYRLIEQPFVRQKIACVAAPFPMFYARKIFFHLFLSLSHIIVLKI